MMGRKITIGMLAAVLVFGCHKPPPPKPPPPPVVWTIPDDRTDQVRDLSERVAQYNSAVADLLGQTTQQHQESAAAILDQLAKILRLAQGSNVTPEFASRISVVEGASRRTALQPSENEAMRASVDILDSIIARDAAGDQQLAPLMADARAKLEPMYTEEGPMHNLVAADTYEAVGKVLSRLGDDLSAQIGIASSDAAPATQASP
jgi:hypothetical protein